MYPCDPQRHWFISENSFCLFVLLFPWIQSVAMVSLRFGGTMHTTHSMVLHGGAICLADLLFLLYIKQHTQPNVICKYRLFYYEWHAWLFVCVVRDNRYLDHILSILRFVGPDGAATELPSPHICKCYARSYYHYYFVYAPSNCTCTQFRPNRRHGTLLSWFVRLASPSGTIIG